MSDGRFHEPLRGVALPFALSLALSLPGLATIPFYSRGEAREGIVVREMLRTGNWILPPRNGDLPSKPPLFHWLGALISKALGRVDEFTIRLPSALLGALGVALIACSAARSWGAGAGVAAGLVLATSFEWWRAATVARVDMALSFFMLSAFLYFQHLYRRGDAGRIGGAILGALLGLATLAKGPLGAVVPSLAWLGFLAIRRDLGFLRRIGLFQLAAAWALVALSWYALAFRLGGERFLALHLLEENVLSAFGAKGHEHPFYYFVPTLFLHAAPWSLFFPSIAAFLWRRRGELEPRGMLYPAVWFAVVFLFFSVARAKRPVYILSLYPAAALLFGAWWSQGAGRQSAIRFPRGSVWAIALFFVAFSLTLAAHSRGWLPSGILAFFSRPVDREVVGADWLRPACWLWAILLASAAFALVVATRRKRWPAVLRTVAAAVAASFLILQISFHPALAHRYSLRPFVDRVLGRVGERPLFFYGPADYVAAFYSRRPLPSFGESAEGAKPPLFLLAWESDWSRLRGRKGMAAIDTSEAVGWDRKGKERLLLIEVTER